MCLVTETFPPEVNGVAMTLERLVAGLRERGHRVDVVRPRQSRGDVGGNGDLTVRGLPLPGYPELKFGLPAGGTLRRRWAERRPDVVHVATEGPLGWSAIRGARRLGIPLSSSFHTNFHTYGDHYGYGLLKRVALWYLRAAHNRTDLTLVPSTTVLDTLRADRFRNLDLLGRGVDTTLFDPARRSEALRAGWGGGDGPVAIHVGRLAGEKNIPLVVAAFEAMRREDPAMRLVLVGDGPARAALERAHPEYRFAGLRRGEDLARHYASGDVFLFPSVTETFGNVVTEALASGLVVLGYDYAAAGQLVRHGANGLVAPFGDEAAFVETAREIARAPRSWPALRAAARATALGASWDRIVRDFEERLRAVARGRSLTEAA